VSGERASGDDGGSRPGTRILVVDEEPSIRTALRASLSARGYQVGLATSCAEATDAVRAQSFDVVLLDLGLPDDDGVEVVRQVRTFSDVAIIVLTADGHEARKVEALDAGADDYITKPFSMPELLARVRVAVRHRGERAAVDESVLTVGDLSLDVGHHRCTVGEREVALTPKEFSLLEVLARWPGKVVTHRMLLHEVWGPDHVNETQYLRTYATTIRRKLGCTADRQRLVSEPGVGYRLVAVT
jgi:two-component system KDP operon response regulator KdpE